MALSTGDTRALADYLASGESPRDAWRVGTEYEKFVFTGDGHRLPYEDQGQQAGMGRLLRDLGGHGRWRFIEEAGHVIGLLKDGASITLEPGGQFELSGAPFATVHETHGELERHLDDMRWLTQTHGVRWGWSGLDPLNAIEGIPWMPKRRYGIMRDYLPTRGALALTMMKGTCMVQANLDFASEVDMGKKLRAGMALGSIVTAMFANSPLRGGKPCGYKSFRAHVWSDTDPDRTGLLPWALTDALATYEQWVDYALDVPMFFFARDGEYIPCAGLPFRRFLSQGHEGHGPTLEDWELHLSTLFPEVRLKTYLEMRSADTVAEHLICALPALWKGLLYDGTALDASWDLVRRWSLDERHAHRREVAVHALEAPVPGKTYGTGELAKELLSIAAHGLKAIAAACGHEDESLHLEPLRRLTDAGRCPADETLAWYARTPSAERDVLGHYSPFQGR